MQGNEQIIRVIIVSFLIAIFLGPVVIPVLRRLKVGQSIREEGPKSHYSKSGTPTMGGVIIIFAIIIAIGTGGVYTQEIWAVLFFIIGFGLIGFLDDYIKVVLKRNLGLKAYQKITGQLIFASLLAWYGANYSVYGTKLVIPFLVNSYFDLGPFYFPFVVFVVLGIVNAVNLTDGLDGLNTGVTLIVMASFSLIANSKTNSAVYQGIAIISAAVSGSCLGFLKYNAHPAKVFMGDTGSLALGGAVAAVAVTTNLLLAIPIIGGIYFAEALSVIIQVLYFKRTGRRIFKMAPIHHHFEMSGWKETKVVGVFWIVTVILALIGIYSI